MTECKVNVERPYFGIIEEYGDLAEQAKLIDSLCIVHSITGTYEFIKPDMVEKLKVDFGRDPWVDGWWFSRSNIVYAYGTLCHVAATIKSNRQRQDKIMPDHIFSVGVADGSAQYVVTSSARVYCEVEWRCYSNPDRYVDRMFGYGGKFRKKDVDIYRGRAGGDIKTLQDTFDKMKKIYVESFKEEPLPSKYLETE